MMTSRKGADGWLSLVLSVWLLGGCHAPSGNSLLLHEGSRVDARLLDEEGAALSSAAIRIDFDQWHRLDADEAVRQSVLGVTDEAGRFVFGYADALNASCSLWADVGDGWRLVEVLSSFDWEDLDEEGSFDFFLKPRDFEFRFQVSDEEGSALGGVKVQLVAGEHGAPVEHLSARETDEDGALTWGPFSYGRWWVELSSHGFAPVRTSPYQHRLEDPAERFYGVRLSPGKEQRVLVLDPSGDPANGASLTYSYENLELPTFSRWTTMTNELGEALIIVPATGYFGVEAERSGLSAAADSATGADPLILRLE